MNEYKRNNNTPITVLRTEPFLIYDFLKLFKKFVCGESLLLLLKFDISLFLAW